MPTQLTWDCPHCGTRRSGFRQRGWTLTNETGNDALVLYVCPVCNGGLMVSLFAPHGFTDLNQASGDPRSSAEIEVTEAWPKSELSAAPEHTPENVAGFYVQADESLKLKHWDAAGAMFRKTLDTGTKALVGEESFKKLTLEKRIDELTKRGLLTSQLGEWAHHIRIPGNDATHDEDPFTEDEATSLKGFAELFLIYVFTMPGMLAARKAEAERLKKDAATAKSKL